MLQKYALFPRNTNYVMVLIIKNYDRTSGGVSPHTARIIPRRTSFVPGSSLLRPSFVSKKTNIGRTKAVEGGRYSERESQVF